MHEQHEAGQEEELRRLVRRLGAGDPSGSIDALRTKVESAICVLSSHNQETKAPEAKAMEHLGLAVANLRAAASWLMDGERNREEIASAIKQADEIDRLMKAVAFNLAGKKHQTSER